MGDGSCKPTYRGQSLGLQPGGFALLMAEISRNTITAPMIFPSESRIGAALSLTGIWLPSRRTKHRIHCKASLLARSENVVYRTLDAALSSPG